MSAAEFSLMLPQRVATCASDAPNLISFQGNDVTPSGIVNDVVPEIVTVVTFVGAATIVSPAAFTQLQLAGSSRLPASPSPVHVAVTGMVGSAHFHVRRTFAPAV